MSAHDVCPSVLGPLLASSLRRLIHHPERMLAPYLTVGMTVLDVGPGMGFFTLPMARLVGLPGRVVAVDLQPAMLAGLRHRAERAELADRIITRVAIDTSLALPDYAGRIDFALLFYLVHEVPDPDRLFAEIGTLLKPGACALVAEPVGHVSRAAFHETLGRAQARGLSLVDRPRIAFSHTALLRK